MNISKVEPIVLNVPLENAVVTSFGSMKSRTAVLVRIETDSGEYGIGEIWNNFPSWGVYEKLATLKHGIAPLLIGEDPRAIAKINEKILRSCTILGLQWGAIGPIYHCLSGVDIALWDLAGRHLGQPIWQMLGGKLHDEVDVYASGLGPGPFEKLVVQHQKMGITAFKLKVGKNEDQDLANLRKMRDMLQDNDRLMIDANQAWDGRTAIRTLNQWKPYDLTWIEEPLRCDDLEGLSMVREQTGIPVVAGENIYGRRHARMALEKNALDIIQPDLSKNGGISECRAMAEAAGSWEVPFAPHYLGGAVCLAASLHFFASIPGGVILELDANPNPFREKLFTDPFVVRGGKIKVPDGPGLGFELDPEFIDYYRVSINDELR